MDEPLKSKFHEIWSEVDRYRDLVGMAALRLTGSQDEAADLNLANLIRLSNERLDKLRNETTEG